MEPEREGEERETLRHARLNLSSLPGRRDAGTGGGGKREIGNCFRMLPAISPASSCASEVQRMSWGRGRGGGGGGGGEGGERREFL